MHKATEKALNQLRDRIKAGEWSENSFLPAERKLCAELEVGRGAVAAIFRELTLQGLIAIEPGRGVRVLSSGGDGGGALRQVLVIEYANYSISNSAEHLQLLGHLSQATAAHGIGMSLAFIDLGQPIKPILDRYARDEFQAVIVVERPELIDIELLLRHGIPTVVINYEAEGKFPCVRVDFREIGRIAGREFVRAGLRRIGVLAAASDSFFCREMIAGLRGVLAEEDLALDPGRIIYWTNPSDLLRSVPPGTVTDPDPLLLEFLSRSDRPEAFFVIRDWRAARIYEIARRLGLAIPADLALISYDNVSWVEAPSVGLSTISEPTEALAEQSIAMLREWKQSGKRPANVKIGGELIRRASLPPGGSDDAD